MKYGVRDINEWVRVMVRICGNYFLIVDCFYFLNDVESKVISISE